MHSWSLVCGPTYRERFPQTLLMLIMYAPITFSRFMIATAFLLNSKSAHRLIFSISSRLFLLPQSYSPISLTMAALLTSTSMAPNSAAIHSIIFTTDLFLNSCKNAFRKYYVNFKAPKCRLIPNETQPASM